MTTQEAQKRALAKALTLGLHRRVERVRYGVYILPSTSREGLTHTVTHAPGDDDTLFCDCLARFHPACVHRASVWLAKLEARGLRVKAPTKTEKEAA